MLMMGYFKYSNNLSVFSKKHVALYAHSDKEKPTTPKLSYPPNFISRHLFTFGYTKK